MSDVRVIRDANAAQAGDDFLRVSCQGDESTGVFTVIERIVAPDAPAGSGRQRLKRLFDGLLRSPEAALELAIAYARHKGIPVVFARTRRQ